MHIISKVFVSFERASTRGQTQTGLGPRFILLLSQTAVLPGSDVGIDGLKANIRFRRPKPSDFVLHVVPDVWDTLVYGLFRGAALAIR